MSEDHSFPAETADDFPPADPTTRRLQMIIAALARIEAKLDNPLHAVNLSTEQVSIKPGTFVSASSGKIETLDDNQPE